MWWMGSLRLERCEDCEERRICLELEVVPYYGWHENLRI